MKRTASLAASALALAFLLPGGAGAESPQAADPAAASAVGIAQGEVARATFTSAVVDREPADELRAVEESAPAVAYFTELKGMEGQTVIHRWEYAGEVMGEVAFDVEGPRWRVHSTKQLDPAFAGEWTVTVMDVDGKVLNQDRLQVGTAVASREASAEAPPAAPAED